MARHVLRFTVTGSDLEAIELHASTRLAEYVGGSIDAARLRLEDAEIDAEPSTQLLDGTTSYTAEVKVQV